MQRVIITGLTRQPQTPKAPVRLKRGASPKSGGGVFRSRSKSKSKTSLHHQGGTEIRRIDFERDAPNSASKKKPPPAAKHRDTSPHQSPNPQRYLLQSVATICSSSQRKSIFCVKPAPFRVFPAYEVVTLWQIQCITFCMSYIQVNSTGLNIQSNLTHKCKTSAQIVFTYTDYFHQLLYRILRFILGVCSNVDPLPWRVLLPLE